MESSEGKSKGVENAAGEMTGSEILRSECGDRPVGIGIRDVQDGQGEAGRGRGVEHFGQGRVGDGAEAEDEDEDEV